MARYFCPSPVRFVVPAFLLLVALSAVLGGTLAPAQSVFETAIERHGPVRPDRRQELLRQLQAHAAVLQAQSDAAKLIVKLVGPAVVHIDADVTDQTVPIHGRRRFREEAGSGVIVRIGDAFCVLTNRHVVNGAAPDKIKITLADGRPIQPKQVWTEMQTDVGVLRIEAPDLVAADVGDSDALEIGDFVFAMGSPFGLSHSVTFGIISAKGRRELELGHSGLEFQDFLQTDAAINPGNSGGPLVNLQGQVIGINTAIASNSGGSEGIGFTIPIRMFMFTARQLVETGKVRRAYLGVSLSPDFDAAAAAAAGLPRPFGTLVSDVIDGTPAAQAGIRKGDIILQFDGVVVEDDTHLINAVKLTEIDRQVAVVVLRDRQPLTLQLRLAELADE
ncbi:MAG: PDZ domain-containing protein [Planctomycetaceae bacterium]|nr:PDZ domain-containing protein [Planctomycetaceae bacterium]